MRLEAVTKCEHGAGRHPETTLIVEKVNGDWPVEAVEAMARSSWRVKNFAKSWDQTTAAVREVYLFEATEALDALLAHHQEEK